MSYYMIMAHDAASGEIIEERDRVVMDWTRTQSVGLVGQLDCGSRAFDYRPHLQHGVLFAHHDSGLSIVDVCFNISLSPTSS